MNDPVHSRGVRLLALLFYLCALALPVLTVQVTIAGTDISRDHFILGSLADIWKSGSGGFVVFLLATLVLVPIVRHLALLILGEAHPFSILASTLFAFDLTVLLFVALVLGVILSSGNAALHLGAFLLLAAAILPPTARLVSAFCHSQKKIQLTDGPSSVHIKGLLFLSLVLLCGSLFVPFVRTTVGGLVTQEKTILSGLVTLWQTGHHAVAALIATFSVAFPALKILALLVFSFGIVRPYAWMRDALVFGGPLSMLDVLAVFVMVVYYSNTFFIAATPAPEGVSLFALSVVLTTFASHALFHDSAPEPDIERGVHVSPAEQEEDTALPKALDDKAKEPLPVPVGDDEADQALPVLISDPETAS